MSLSHEADVSNEAIKLSFTLKNAGSRDGGKVTQNYTVEPGKYELLIGDAADDIRLCVPL